MTSTEPRQPADTRPVEAERQAGQAPAKRSRLVVVHPNQVFQRDDGRASRRGFDLRRRLTLDGVVVRYMMVSAVIVAALTSLTALGVALLDR